ncbi:MAG: hypothetical protein U1F46_17385 [Marinagarivorans sp.]
MLAETITGVMMILGAALGSRMGLGAVSRQILATGLALALATYLAPLIARGLQAWFSYTLVWFCASLLLFFGVAVAAQRAMTLFSQAIQLPKWVSRAGGAGLMAMVAALAAGLLLWTIHLSLSLQAMAAQTHATRPEGLYAWASREVDAITRWSLRASGVPAPLANGLGRIAAEPGFYLQQLVAIALSTEFKAFWTDPEAQTLLAQQAGEPLTQLPSGQKLLELPAVTDLLQVLPVEASQGGVLIMTQLSRLWALKQRVLLDGEIQALLADGTLVERLAQQDLAGVLLNPHWRPLIGRIEVILSADADTHHEPQGPIPAPETVIPAG